MKDWTGNNRPLGATLGASSHTTENRQREDYYATDPDMVRDLLNALLTLQGKVVLSGYDNDLYNSMLLGWNKASCNTLSNMSKRRQEVLWMNYNPQLTLF